MKKERAKHMAIPFVCLCLATTAQAAPGISKITPPRHEFSSVVQNDTQTGKKRIEGRVVDDKNSPLPGVSVTSTKTHQKTVTDATGRFFISLPEGTRTDLQFTLV